MISQNSVDAIFAAIDLDDWANHPRIQNLKKSGRSYRAISPFNPNEKTPSFYVWKDSTMYKDFSTGKSGNFISFLMDMDAMTYPEALEKVAADHNIVVEYVETKKTDAEVEAEARLKKCMERSLRAYQNNLWKLAADHPAWVHLREDRHYDDDTILQWGIGYAPDAWTWLWNDLRERGYYREGIDTGLLRTNDSAATYDAIRNAVVYPIYDHLGHAVSYGRRTLDADFKMNGIPKWLNGAGYKLYDKSATLYGFHAARKAIRMHRNAYLVEGYDDVVSMHRAGAANTVATCGTALTSQQCAALKRYTPRVTIIRDGDEAGQKAALRDFEMLIAHGLEVFHVNLPDGVDPGDYVRTVMEPRVHDSNLEREEMTAL